VRWRISEGLRRVRSSLDRAHQERPRGWRALLLPLAGPRPDDPIAVPAPAPATGAAAKVIVIGGAAALGIAGALLWMSGRTAGPETRPSVAAAASPTPASDRTRNTRQEERTMTRNPGTKAAALFGVVLPALVASAEGSKPLPRDEAIAFCVEQREWILQKCKQEYADLLVSRTPPDQRAAKREEWLKKIEEGGKGPLEPRKQKCAAELDKGTQLASISNYGDREAIRTCQKEADCNVALACAQKVMFGKKPKP
jgi:hypothetical protein